MSKQIAQPHAKQQYVAHQAAQTTIQAHAGPLPNPETLAQYNSIIPDGAERIMKMAESQALHRQDLEQYMVRTSSRLAYFGVSSAFVISMTAILCGFYLVLSGFQISGTIFTGMGLSGLTATFIYGTQSQREERQRRNAVNQEIAQRGQMQ
jgi:uncharacterized membrane protein